MKRSLLAVVLGLFAVSATAGTITSISPSMVKVNSGEHFLSIYGTGLGNVVVFQGPAGTLERNTSANCEQLLKSADLVRTERRGQSIVYSLNTSIVEEITSAVVEIFQAAPRPRALRARKVSP